MSLSAVAAAAALLLFLLPVPVLSGLAVAAAPAAKDRADPNAPRAQVVLALQLTRADGAAAPNGPGQVIGAPVLSTLDRNTGSIQITGGEMDYAISVSPTIEGGNNVALLWTLQISGKSLPGATSVALNGATRVARNKTEPLTEVTLRDPKTGKSSLFRLLVKTTVTEPEKTGAGADAAAPR